MKYPFKSYVILPIILVVSILVGYFLSSYIYYEQDEYYLFYICNNLQFPFLTLTNEHFTPLRDWLFCTQYYLFGLYIFPRLVVAVFFHFVSIYLVYILLKKFKITHPVITPLLLLFLATNVTISQAYLWLSTYSGTMPSIIFSLLSLIKYLDYIKDRKRSDMYFCFSYLLIALLFKEYAIFLFPFYFVTPFSLRLFGKKHNLRKYKYFFITLFSFVFIYVFFRGLIQLNSTHSELITNNLSSNNVLQNITAYFSIGNISLLQIIFPYKFFFDIIQIQINDIQNQLYVYNVTSIIGGILWVFILLILIVRKGTNLKKTLAWVIVLYLFTLIPFTILSPYSSYIMLENRYYYLLAIVWVLFLSTLITSNKNKMLQKLFSLLILVVVLINISYYYKMLLDKKSLKEIRTRIVNTIIDDIAKQNIDDQLIILVDGNIPGYYGLPTLKIPFQTGFGNLLAIHLYNSGIFVNKTYFENQDTMKFYEINSEDVMKFNNKKTYGYFQNNESLLNYIKKNPKEINNVHCYYWDYQKEQMLIQTDVCREKLTVAQKMNIL